MLVEIAAPTPGLSAEWHRLWRRSGESPFVSPGWVYAWHAAFGRGPLIIATCRDQGGDLRAVLPLLGARGCFASPTNWHTPLFGVLATDDAARDEVLRGALRASRHYLRLSFIDEALADRMATLAGALGRPVSRHLIGHSPYLPAPEVGAAPRPGKLGSKNTRKKVRKWRRRLEETATIQLEVSDDPGRSLAQFLQLEDSGWKRAKRTSILSHRRTAEFYRSVASWGARNDLLRVVLLRAGAEAIAGDFSLEDARAHYVLKTGFDERFQEFGPGNLLRHDMLAKVLHTGRQYEFCGLDASWKRQWTSHGRALYRVQVFGTSPLGMTIGWTERALRLLARAVIIPANRLRARLPAPPEPPGG